MYCLIGFLLTPIAILWAVMSAGAGHAAYVAARVLFPYEMLFASLIGPIAFIPALVQFPLYGAALDFAIPGDRIGRTVAIIAGTHSVFAVASFFVSF